MSILLTYVFIGAAVAATLYAFNRSDFKHKMLHNAYLANHRKEYYRLLSSGFVHADYMHLLLNMWALFLFGKMVEEYFDYFFGYRAGLMFCALYLGGIIVANLPDFFRYKNIPAFNSLGASGGVSSIIFCAVLLQPTMELYIFPIPFALKAYIFAAIYVAYSIFMEKKQLNNVNHMAHLWGAIWGVAFLLITQPSVWNSFLEQIKNQ